LHPTGSHEHWSESFCFNFYDKSRDLCGLMRIGSKPNLRTKEMFCHFVMPDGSFVGLEGLTPSDSQQLTARGLRFEMLEPEKTWGLTYAGGMERTMAKKERKSHVEFNLAFEALNDMFDYGSQTRQRGDRDGIPAASGRFEQMGRVRGSLSIGLDDFKVDALGARTHSWGTHDWTALKGWTWVTCQFSDSHSVSYANLVGDWGTTNAGFIFVDGRNIPVDKVDLNVNADFNRNIKSFDMTLHDPEGGTHKVFGSIFKRVDVHHKSPDGRSMTTMNELLTRYTYAGKVGYGFAEVLGRIE
jgi:hypothetical protein